MPNCGKDTLLAGNVETSFLEAARDVCWQFELLLQDGIEPMWEDERNKRGGRWLVTLTKQQRRLDLDRYWLETVGLTVLVLFIPLLKPVTIIIISLTSPQSSTFITPCYHYTCCLQKGVITTKRIFQSWTELRLISCSWQQMCDCCECVLSCKFEITTWSNESNWKLVCLLGANSERCSAQMQERKEKHFHKL